MIIQMVIVQIILYTPVLKRIFLIKNLSCAGLVAFSIFFNGLASAGNISSANTSGGVTNATFAYFAAGFRLSQKHGWGLSFGLMPFSGIGYKINRSIQTSTFTFIPISKY
jgi:hypothetical protein